MKRFLLLGISMAVLGGALPQVYADAMPGQAAPDFSAPASDGKTYRLADYHATKTEPGKFVVLEWYNPGCPFIRKHYDSGNMQKLQETYRNKGVIWFEIASSAPGKEGYLTKEDAIKQRIQDKTKSTATLLDSDGKVGKLYGAKCTPHMFVIDPKGKVVYAGAIDDHRTPDPEDIPQSKNYVALALDQALAGKPVATPSTQPYGCSVKYK
jgi:peroxiredoxin